jgi:uncharacterized protein (DUF1810 family)
MDEMAAVIACFMNLTRFLEAQEPVYTDALAELQAGRKHTIVLCAAQRAPGPVTHSAPTNGAPGPTVPVDHLLLAAPWIWFILPQLRGLGHSTNAIYYGLENATEATAYLAHPVLGARLRECVTAILAHKDKTAHTILGTPDDLKFRSCLTLFRAVAAPNDHLWQDALDQFYAGHPDETTLRLLTTK